MTEFSASTAVRLSGGHGSALDPDAAREFAESFYAAVAELGVPAEPDPFDADLEPFGAAGRYAAKHQEPDKSGTFLTVVLVVTVFVGTELGSWAVARSANTVWDKVSPALGRLIARLRRREQVDAASSDARIVLRTVYGTDQVVVELEAPVEALGDGQVGKLLEQAHEFARKAVAATPEQGVKVVRCKAGGTGVDGAVETVDPR
ncbi:MAG: hypothetical protein QOF58_347 [Pseudonocardiales bacterium]|nr:hypothetical protein [Pseudonocardiales bacterium]